VRQPAIEGLARRGDALAIEVLHLEDVVDVRRAVRRAGHQRRREPRPQDVAERLELDERHLGYEAVQVLRDGVQPLLRRRRHLHDPPFHLHGRARRQPCEDGGDRHPAAGELTV
jgi:hypothetical protein